MTKSLSDYVFGLFDTQAWKYVPKCPTYPNFPRLSDRLSHFSRHYPRQITISFNYGMSGLITAQIEFFYSMKISKFIKNKCITFQEVIRDR